MKTVVLALFPMSSSNLDLPSFHSRSHFTLNFELSTSQQNVRFRNPKTMQSRRRRERGPELPC